MSARRPSAAGKPRRSEHLSLVPKGADLVDGVVGFSKAWGAETLVHLKISTGEHAIDQTTAIDPQRQCKFTPAAPPSGEPRSI
jgi:hypothetical protein